jgi:hypothetical protein
LRILFLANRACVLVIVPPPRLAFPVRPCFRARFPENVTFKIGLGSLPNCSDLFFALVLDTVEALLQFPRLFCSASLAILFEADFDDSWIRRPANQNSYHQYFPRLDSDMLYILAEEIKK